jgi:crossover junction endodeoxyribonuclease RusA
MIKFTVAGTPVPQGSGFAVSKHGQLFNPRAAAVKPWREAVRAETQRAAEAPIDGPVCVSILFRLRRPQAHYRTGRNAHLLKDTAPRYPAGKPDIDKLTRAVLDGLTEGGAFHDDAQVVSLGVDKHYGTTPGADIEVEEMG